MTYEEKFFSEAAIVLHRSGCRTGTPENGRLPINFCGNADLTMDTNGTVYIEKLHVPYEDIADEIASIRRAGHDVAEYMKAMETAPDLKAGGLADGYKILAEYAGTVFAGHRTRFGMEFITWRRDADGRGLCYGDYFGGNYTGAKLDFAQRAELAEKFRFFDHEQLAELYRLCERERSSRYLLGSRDRLLYRIQSQILEIDPSAAVLPEQAEELDEGWDEETPESIDIFLEDLTPRKQSEILRLMGDNCNFDIYPVTSIPVEPQAEPEFTL